MFPTIKLWKKNANVDNSQNEEGVSIKARNEGIIRNVKERRFRSQVNRSKMQKKTTLQFRVQRSA